MQALETETRRAPNQTRLIYLKDESLSERHAHTDAQTPPHLGFTKDDLYGHSIFTHTLNSPHTPRECTQPGSGGAKMITLPGCVPDEVLLTSDGWTNPSRQHGLITHPAVCLCVYVYLCVSRFIRPRNKR